MKKFVSVLLALVLVAALAVTAFAASDTNADEQRILDALAETREIGGKTAEIPADIQNEAKTWTMRDDVDLTKEQADAIIAKIEEIMDKIAEYAEDNADENVIQSFTTEQKKDLIALAQEAGKVADVTVSYDFATDKLVISDNAGTLIGAYETALKFTGSETVTLVALVAGILALIAGGAIVSKKANLFA